MKKIISVLWIGMISVLIVGCSKKEKNQPFLNSVNDVYGFGAVSTVNLLNHCVMDTQSTPFTIAEDEDSMKEIIDKFNSYFVSLDCFLSDDVITTSTEDNLDAAYPYPKKMTTKGKDMLGNDVIHTMYFTETLIKEEQEEDEKEQSFRIEGILLSEEKEFYITGNRETEISKDEQEDEIKIRAYEDEKNQNTYVEMEQGISLEENEMEKEYTYRVVVEGKLVEETSIEFERETDTKEEIEYELEFLNGTGKGKYSIESVTIDQTTMIEVKYNVDAKKGSFYVQKTIDSNGKACYEYKVGTVSYIFG